MLTCFVLRQIEMSLYLFYAVEMPVQKKTGRTLPDTSNIYIAQWASEAQFREISKLWSEVTGTVTGEVTGYASGRGIMSDDVFGENFDNER